MKKTLNSIVAERKEEFKQEWAKNQMRLLKGGTFDKYIEWYDHSIRTAVREALEAVRLKSLNPDTNYTDEDLGYEGAVAEQDKKIKEFLK